MRWGGSKTIILFQHTAARRRLDEQSLSGYVQGTVSTHSRPKAAGAQVGLKERVIYLFQHTAARRRLGKPPQGGFFIHQFQHTAARRRLVVIRLMHLLSGFCFNTQPPEGGWLLRCGDISKLLLFQHTAARRRLVYNSTWTIDPDFVSTHSRPKAAGFRPQQPKPVMMILFQHTAARRRLAVQKSPISLPN